MFSSFLLPFFPFHLSFKCGRLLSLSLGTVSRGWGNSKTEGEGVIWSARPLEVTIGNGKIGHTRPLEFVGGVAI